jgi:hypothetical protein
MDNVVVVVGGGKCVSLLVHTYVFWFRLNNTQQGQNISMIFPDSPPKEAHAFFRQKSTIFKIQFVYSPITMCGIPLDLNINRDYRYSTIQQNSFLITHNTHHYNATSKGCFHSS